MIKTPSLRIRILFALVVAVVTATVAGVILEGILRLTDPPQARSGPATIVVSDDLGWDASPSVEVLENRGAGPVVYFAGDSFTHATKWPRHAQALARQHGIEVQGYNLGVSGYGATQSLLKIQRDFDRHKPSLVLLQIYAWNDLRDDYPYPGVFYSPERSWRPYFLREGSGFVLHSAPSEGLLSRWFGWSHIYQRVLVRAYLRTTKILAERDIDRFSRREMAVPVHFAERAAWEPFYLPRTQNRLYVRNAYATFEHVLVTLHAYLTARGATLALLAIGNAFTVDQDVLQAHASESDFNPTLPEETIAKIAERHGILFVSLVEPLRTLAKQRTAKVYNPPPGTLAGHLEPEGDVVVGRVASEVIVRLFKRDSSGLRSDPPNGHSR